LGQFSLILFLGFFLLFGGSFGLLICVVLDVLSRISLEFIANSSIKEVWKSLSLSSVSISDYFLCRFPKNFYIELQRKSLKFVYFILEKVQFLN